MKYIEIQNEVVSKYHIDLCDGTKCKKYGIEIPQKTIKEYQDYIKMEVDRGKRRGGEGYGNLKLVKA